MPFICLKDMIYDRLLVFNHEVIRLLRSLRFRISFVLIVLLFAGGSRLFVSLYTEQLTTYEQLRTDAELKDRHLSGNLTNFANHLRIFRFSPRVDGFIYSCQEEEMVNSIQYNVWNAGGLEVEQGMLNPLLNAKSSVDWTFIVSIFISFIALLFSFDSICGEKRDKVLGYLLTYPISRKHYWISKIASHVAVMMLLLLGGVCVGLLALGSLLPRIYTASLCYEVIGFIGISFLLVTLCVCLGLFASVATRHSNVSLLACVSFWLFCTVIIPNSATFWGETLYPIPLLRDIGLQVDKEEARLMREAPPGSQAQDSDPFYPYHERRAALLMKKKELRETSYLEYYERLMRQFEGIRRLTLLSPVVQYERAMEALLGGGYLRFLRNWEELRIFRQEFLVWFKEKDAADPDSPHWYNPYEDTSTSKKAFDLSEAPRYQEKTVPIARRLSLIGGYMLVTVLFIGVLAWAGFRLLEKYDVR